jgi:hypothetical protein
MATSKAVREAQCQRCDSAARVFGSKADRDLAVCGNCYYADPSLCGLKWHKRWLADQKKGR